MSDTEGKVELTRRELAMRVGRIRAYLKAAIDAGDFEEVGRATAQLKDSVDELGMIIDETEADGMGERLANLERAFAAILAGMQAGGQKHPHADAVTEGKPVRFVFGKGRDGKLVVNFVPLEVEG